MQDNSTTKSVTASKSRGQKMNQLIWDKLVEKVISKKEISSEIVRDLIVQSLASHEMDYVCIMVNSASNNNGGTANIRENGYHEFYSSQVGSDNWIYSCWIVVSE